MAIYSHSFTEAQDNFLNKNKYSRWYCPEARPELVSERLKDKIICPAASSSRKIHPGDKIFTIGSCFAREVERSLSSLGHCVDSLVKEDEFDRRFDKGFVNRYNTYSIKNELEWAAGTKPFPAEHIFEVGPGKTIDLQSHPIGGLEHRSLTEKRRSQITTYFAKALTADIVTITLGLIEGWYDNEIGEFIGFAPIFGSANAKIPLLSDNGRFEFKVTGFEENMSNLESIFSVLKLYNPKCHIIVTVSPVPLSATFSTRDVIVANSLSKSMLRTCAETWVRLHPGEIDYFPSYEMATLSHREVVWAPDTIHVRSSFVDEIMLHFQHIFLNQ